MILSMLNRKPNTELTTIKLVMTKEEFHELRRLQTNYIILSRMDKIKKTYASNSKAVVICSLFFKALAKQLKNKNVIMSIDKASAKYVRLPIIELPYKVIKEQPDTRNSITKLLANSSENVISIEDNTTSYEVDMNIL